MDQDKIIIDQKNLYPIFEVYDIEDPINKQALENKMNLYRWRYEIEYGKTEKNINHHLMVSLSLNVFLLFYILFS